MNKKILHTPDGVRDIYGSEIVLKRNIEQNIAKTIFSYGYEEIQTPTFEYFDVFSKEIGTTPCKDLYKFFDKDGETLVLRPDFTPSIARCASKYFKESTEAKRFFYAGNAFINTAGLQGKLKETTQMGAELIGDDSVYADAEMIAMMIGALKASGIDNLRVSIGNVDYYKGLCEEAGLSEDTEYELREYVSGKNLFAATALLKESNIAEPYLSNILKFADFFNDYDALSDAKKLVKNERSIKAIERLEQLYEILKTYGVEEYVSFDLSMLSKYNYYTGVVFKAFTYGKGTPVCKGGRYNNLLATFGKNAPAVGFVAIVDDICDAVRSNGIKEHEVHIIALEFKSGNKKDFEEKFAEASKLRAEGKNVVLRGI